VISIPKKLYDEMMEFAKKGFPNEACGILAGAPQRVTHFYPMRNMDESSISYFMDPKEQLKVFKDMRAKDIQMLGIFHSHVASEAYPSQKDVRLAHYPEVSYLIVSLSDMKQPILRSFRINEEHVEEEEIKIA
jgi:proteasome lid subunit RPN8/RPN11